MVVTLTTRKRGSGALSMQGRGATDNEQQWPDRSRTLRIVRQCRGADCDGPGAAVHLCQGP